MLLTKLTLLANHLSIRDYSIHEVLDFLLRIVLTPIKSTSIIYFRSNDLDSLDVIGMAGVSTEESAKIKSAYLLSEQCPAAVAIRSGSYIWVDDSRESLRQYPEVENLSPLLKGRTLIACPIYSDSTPSAAIAIFVEGDLKPNAEIELFLTTILSILGLYFTKTKSMYPTLSSPVQENLNTQHVSNKLTERQLVIMKLVSEGRTNLNISQILSYSESTVRQEIMKIFKLYHLDHRSEVARALNSIPKNINHFPSKSIN